MLPNMFYYIVFSVLFLCKLTKQEYNVPEPTFELLHPKGFTASIPDDPGIQRFEFQGNLNYKLEGREVGQFGSDITHTTDGRWMFVDRNTKFKNGDIIYYRLSVDYLDGTNKKGYLKENQKYVVTNVAKNNGNNGNNGNKGNKGNKKKGNQGNHGNNKNHGGQIELRNLDDYEGGNENQYLTTPEPASTSCKYSPTKINGQNTCSGKLIFSEEFNELNYNIWQNEVKFADDPDYEFVSYGIYSGSLYTNNGALHIKPALAEDKLGAGFVTRPGGLDLAVNCTGVPGTRECKSEAAAYFIIPPVVSGKINSRPSFSFLYGRIDVRAKLPKGDWIYPELFLTPKKYEYGEKHYESGEIRIAFLPGNANFGKELQGGVIFGESDEARQYGLRKLNSGVNWNDDFHVYTVIWKPVDITLLVDDKVYATIAPPPNGFASAASTYNPDGAIKWKTGDTIAPFDKEMVVTVGVGVGGNSFPDTFPGKPYNNIDGKGPFKFNKGKNTWLPTWNDDSELVVDYIKVYAV